MAEQPTQQAVEFVEELGPVDWLVVEFPGSGFTGEIAPTLDALVDNGTNLDLDLVPEGEDGSISSRRAVRSGAAASVVPSGPPGHPATVPA